MKKITFILFALIAGTAFAQNSVEGTATVNAVIVSPLTISSTGALNFGTFTTSVNDATILISADGSTKTFSETDMELPGDTHSVPTFTVTREDGLEYNLSLLVSKNPQVGTDGASLSLTNLTSTISESNNSAESFSVGGTLNVPASATEGTYSGEVKVTVSYN